MTKVLITESYLDDIADSIRAKNGTQNTYKPSEMASAIDAISGGGITPTGTINITANGTGIDVSSYALADVAVPSSGITPTGTKEISITQNGTTTEDVTNYASAEINVNVSAPSPTLQTKTVTPSESTQNVSADNGYDGLSQVTVNPIPSSYVQPSGSLSITTNDTYDVSQYASAVVNVSGSGGGSGTTVTVTTAYTNAKACIEHLVTNVESNKVYTGVLINKSVSNFVTDQLVAFTIYSSSHRGFGLRYRSGAISMMGGTSDQYDAKIVVGDTYSINEYEFN